MDERCKRLFNEYKRIQVYLMCDSFEEDLFEYFDDCMSKLGDKFLKLCTAYYSEVDYKAIEKTIINLEYLLGIQIFMIDELNNMVKNKQLIDNGMPFEEMYDQYYIYANTELHQPRIRPKSR